MNLSIEKKHELYEKSVQSVDTEVEFLAENYKRFFKKEPISLREDFSGTSALCAEWIKNGDNRTAIGIDIDESPMKYGWDRHFSKLTEEQKKRFEFVCSDVKTIKERKSDITVAFNFSYMIFKKRKELLDYFKSVYDSLNEEGVFFIDLLGGPEVQEVLEEETEYDNHSYFWDCDSFNPINNDVKFAIHFKVDGRKYQNVFTYDWRLWSLPELRDILEEAGFSKTYAYWEEDDDESDEGSGDFYITEEAENCESWVTYIAALK